MAGDLMKLRYSTQAKLMVRMSTWVAIICACLLSTRSGLGAMAMPTGASGPMQDLPVNDAEVEALARYALDQFNVVYFGASQEHEKDRIPPTYLGLRKVLSAKVATMEAGLMYFICLEADAAQDLGLPGHDHLFEVEVLRHGPLDVVRLSLEGFRLVHDHPADDVHNMHHHVRHPEPSSAAPSPAPVNGHIRRHAHHRHAPAPALHQ